MIIHQTWKTARTDTWSEADRQGANAWLHEARGDAARDLPPMAYIFWDDEAADALVRTHEQDLWEGFRKLPHGVERADILRVLVLKWFGGVVRHVHEISRGRTILTRGRVASTPISTPNLANIPSPGSTSQT